MLIEGEYDGVVNWDKLLLHQSGDKIKTFKMDDPYDNDISRVQAWFDTVKKK